MKKLLISILAMVLFISVGCKKTQENDGYKTTTNHDSTKNATSGNSESNSSSEKMDTTGKDQSIMSKTIDQGNLNLTKATVTGNLMNVEFVITNPDKNVFTANIPVSEIYYIDDATAKKNGLLKDDSGKYMVSPTNTEGNKLLPQYIGESNVILTLKFPAPPKGSKTVSITLGKYGSFDNVPIKN